MKPEVPPEAEFVPKVLLIGGMDPTSGAGVGRDLITLTHWGVYPTVAVSAITVQTSLGVSEIVVTPSSVVRAQCEAAREEYGVDVIKTGMLASVDQVLAMAELAARWGSSVRLVCDPVLRSTSGRELLNAEGTRALAEQLLPHCAVVTPNVPEAEALSGVTVRSRDDMEIAAAILLGRGASAVLLKGGHLLDEDQPEGPVFDLLRTMDGDGLWLERPRLPGSFRGTGCTLASAVAAGVAQGLRLLDAVEQARAYLEKLMLSAPPMGRAARPLAVEFVR